MAFTRKDLYVAQRNRRFSITLRPLIEVWSLGIGFIFFLQLIILQLVHLN